MANQFIARNGLVSKGTTIISGSLVTTQPVTFSGSLDVTGSGTFTGNVGIGTTSPSTRLEVISAANEEGIAITDTGGNLKYKVRQFGGNTYSSFWNASNSEIVRITAGGSSYFNGGNVGIGTTSPVAKLHVVDGSENLYYSGSLGNGFRGLNLAGTNPSVRLDGSDDTFIISALSTGFAIWDETASMYRFNILNNGNVGIGTTAPVEKLHINGNVRIGLLGNQGYYLSWGQNEVGSSQDFARIYGIRTNGAGNQAGHLVFQTKNYGSGLTERLRITDTGNILIGTTTDSGAKLHVKGVGTTHSTTAFLVENANASGSLVVRDSGNIGIGTTNPSAKLDVEGTSEFNGQVSIVSSALDMTDSYYLRWGGTVRIHGNSTPNILIFETAATERMRIAEGNVGIGTNTPGHTLDVNGEMRATAYRIGGGTILSGTSTVQLGSSGATGVITFNTTSGEGMRLNGSNVGIGTTSPTAKLQVKGSGTTSSTTAFLVENANASGSMVVLDNGNVGIGTASPAQKLDINGNVKVGTRLAMTPSVFGYSNSWKTLILGSTGSDYNTDAVTITFGVDLSANSNGSYTGNGNEIFFRNYTAFGTPNEDNTGYRYPMRFNSGSVSLVPSYGNVGIGTTAPTAMLNVANSGRALAVFRIQATNRSAFYDNDFAANNDGGGADGFIYGSNSVGGAFPFNGYGEVIIQANPRSGYANGISFVTGTTSPTIKMRILEGGNVGIGTTSPSEKLHVIGNTIIQATSTGNGTTAIRVNNSAGTQVLAIGAAGEIIMNNSSKISTVVDPTSIQPQLELYNSGTGYTTLQSSTSYGLLLNPNGANVGIGTTSPSARLHVSSSNIVQRLESNASYTQLDFYNTSYSSTNSRNWAIGANLYNWGDFNIMASATSASAPNSSYTYFTVNRSGNVGIGTTSPSAKLQVKGAGATDATTAFLVEDTSGTGRFTIYDSGKVSTLGFYSYPESGSVVIGSNTTTYLANYKTTIFGSLGIVPLAGNILNIGTTQNTSSWNEGSAILLEGRDLEIGSWDNNRFSTSIRFNHINNDTESDLIQFTAGAGSSTANPVMVISGSGNVGIGTTLPSQRLHISKTNGTNEFVGIRVENDLGHGEFGTQSNYSRILSNGTLLYAGSAGTTYFYIGTGAQQTTIQTFSYLNGGQVGIGTISPSAKLHVKGSGTTSATTALLIENSAATNLLTIQDNGQLTVSSPQFVVTSSLISLAASESAFTISQPISASNTVGGQYYGVNITPTFYQTTSSQTETAFRVAATFTQSSAAATDGTNIIADFGATSVGSQLTVTDITSGSIYMVNDVSGLPIIEATSDWTVRMYDFPNVVFEKTGSDVNIYGTLNATGSFILPLSQSTTPVVGSAYWSGSFLFIYDGTQYRSSSFA